jgi:hypothetical protein
MPQTVMKKMNKENITEKVEREYPTITLEYKDITAEQYKVFIEKHHDYGDKNITLGLNIEDEEDRNIMLCGLVIRMNDKVQRLLNLLFKRKGEACNESIEDALLDLSNYGIIGQIVNNKKWHKR